MTIDHPIKIRASLIIAIFDLRNLINERASKVLARRTSIELNFPKSAIPSSPALKKSFIVPKTVGTTAKSIKAVAPNQKLRMMRINFLIIINS